MVKHYFENPSFVLLRFIAEDAGDGSLVKAAVDDIHIFYPGVAIFTPGEVNFDASINIQDLVVIVAHILGNATLLGDAALAADYNLDTLVNIQDIVTLVPAIIGD